MVQFCKPCTLQLTEGEGHSQHPLEGAVELWVHTLHVLQRDRKAQQLLKEKDTLSHHHLSQQTTQLPTKTPVCA